MILQVISCGYELQTKKFRKYANETAKLFVKWYKMPAKILIHGADVMGTLLLPIGQLSEEPVTYEKRKKGWRMSCDVGEAKEALENEL